MGEDFVKTRVAVVLPYFGIGGAETMVSRIVSHMDLKVLDVKVFCIYGTPLGNHLEKAIHDHGICIKYIGKGKGFSLSALIRLWKELSDYQPSVIHTHLSACVYCIPWSVCHRKIMLHTVHNIPERELIRAKQIPMSVMYRFGKAVPIAISKEIQKRLITYYGLKSKPIVINNPVDIKRFEVTRKEHQGIVIVTAGRLTEQKNQQFLVEIMRDLCRDNENIRLLILGDGPQKDTLTDYIKKTGMCIKIQLTGNVDDVENYFARSDLFALCSTYEGLPLVILEAMAAGLPIISTDVGGVKDVIGQCGILVTAGNKEEYKAALKRLIADESLRKELGERAHDNAAKYDSSIIAQEYSNVYIRYSI